VGDLLALINNDEGGTLHSFVSWIANLDIDIKNGSVKKRRLLEKAFDLFSEIVGEEVRFDAVTSVDPLELWIKTKDSPHGIPIRLAGYSLQSLMAWIGYFLKRIYDANGGIEKFYEAPAIVIVDEIDLFLHPRWQSRILKVLRKNFPNTQFIVTTHSPLVVDGLALKQITQLYYEENQIIAKPNEVDIWVWQYQDILSRLFQTQQNLTEYEEKVLPEIEKLRAIEQRTKEPMPLN
jgi:predicted ATP-binding protein involved in virulence